MKPLAIIIPAYKSTYLRAALESIANQTCKDFTLYIGDDHSPNNIEEIVNEYKDKIDLVYKRFDTNLGGKDLVAQWERCIDLSQGEPWLWLFSDDDVMDPQCVEKFLQTAKAHPENKFFHFNINVIDGQGNKLRENENWPEHCTVKEYLDGKLSAKGFISYVVEFVYRRDLFYEVKRFQNYDLAWGSDFITWLKLADKGNGIRSIQGPRINWRDSGENISPNRNPDIIFRKMRSVIRSVKFTTDFARQHHYGHLWYYGKYSLGEIRRNRKYLSKEQLRFLSNEYNKINGFKFPLSLVSKVLFKK